MKLFSILCVLGMMLTSIGYTQKDSDQIIPAWEKSSFSFVPRSFQKDPKVDVVILTEFTQLGKKLKKVTPNNPAYYIAGDSGMKEEGEVIAGEIPPKGDALKKAMVAALRTNGYLPYTPNHKPSLVIFFRWGSFNLRHSIDDPMGVNGADPSNPPTPDPLEISELAQRAALIGGTTFAMQMLTALQHNTLDSFANRDDHTLWLVDECYTNRYYIIASAYDFESAMKQKKVLYWKTKISTNSVGLTMNDSILALTLNAGPYFGREMSSAARLNRPVIKEGRVEIGNPTVKNDNDPFIASPKGK
jgi:hypothetical protein